MILYEFPFNENVRTLLRLEELFERVGTLIARDTALDHHFALTTLFEIVEVCARADLKADLLKDLDRQRAWFRGFIGKPDIETARLDEVLAALDRCHEQLLALNGKAGASLSQNDWLMTLRSRIAIPGGTCEFDLPSYHAWQHRDSTARRRDLHQWARTLGPVAEALDLLLRLMRESGESKHVVAQGGQYQQTLSARRTYQLLRLRLPQDVELVPEISGHRLMVSVRLMQLDEEQRPRLAFDREVQLELTLCS